MEKTTDIGKCRVVYRPSGRAGEYSPLALNLYAGCRHGCKYCYVPNCLRQDRQEFHAKVNVRKDVIKNLARDLGTVKITEPVLLCFTCDPYTPDVKDDPQNFTTRKALILLSENNVNFQILTKGGLHAVNEFDLYRPGDKFAVSLTFFDPQGSQAIEPFAALPEERIESLKQAKLRDIKTWVSLEPALDEIEIHQLINASAPFADFYKLGKVSSFPSRIKDWAGYVARVTKHLDQLGKPYMLKKDLKSYQPQPMM